MVNNALIFGIVTIASIIVSLFLDRKKTFQGIKKGFKMFFNIVPLS